MPTWRWRWRSPARPRGRALTGAPRACFGELGLTGELRWVGHPERRLQEAAKHGLEEVIAPPGSGAGGARGDDAAGGAGAGARRAARPSPPEPAGRLRLPPDDETEPERQARPAGRHRRG